jgi:hypothetical protein
MGRQYSWMNGCAPTYLPLKLGFDSYASESDDRSPAFQVRVRPGTEAKQGLGTSRATCKSSSAWSNELGMRDANGPCVRRSAPVQRCTLDLDRGVSLDRVIYALRQALDDGGKPAAPGHFLPDGESRHWKTSRDSNLGIRLRYARSASLHGESGWWSRPCSSRRAPPLPSR